MVVLRSADLSFLLGKSRKITGLPALQQNPY